MIETTSLSSEAVQPTKPVAASSRVSPWAAFVTAVQFLTRVPLPARGPVSAATLARAPAYFPLVGALIGAFTCVVLGVAIQVWPIWLSVLVALAIEARLTGALHEDALADFCDAFGGGWSREDVLRILKDSRLGTYGALGLGLGIALRAGAMMEIIHQFSPEHWEVWAAALVASSTIGRWAIVVVMFRLPPIASRDSVSRDIASQMRPWDLAVATLWTLPATIWFAVLSPWQAVLAVLLLAPAIFWFVRYVHGRLGGSTGDCLGCIGYITQVLVLLAAAARWPG